ncbi:pre-toxin TG domain-containing protein [Marinicrinis sediminis]|uniref:Pre-toxin TG domain-containing protein n=1 Tax=Marinicrinis sediminis TaxID=1652465 RepID=A0ABW5RAZ9_9BACL
MIPYSGSAFSQFGRSSQGSSRQGAWASTTSTPVNGITSKSYLPHLQTIPSRSSSSSDRLTISSTARSTYQTQSSSSATHTSKSSSSSSSSDSNQKKYLENLTKTGNEGQKKWAEAELSKMNQNQYLNNLIQTGNEGQKKWAQNQLAANAPVHSGQSQSSSSSSPATKSSTVSSLSSTSTNTASSAAVYASTSKVSPSSSMSSNQQAYLQNLLKTGNAGEQKWAASQLVSNASQTARSSSGTAAYTRTSSGTPAYSASYTASRTGSASQTASVASGTTGSSSSTANANQQAYLQSLLQTGNEGQQKWAQAELNKMNTNVHASATISANQKAYLQNMLNTGNEGQQKWAADQLGRAYSTSYTPSHTPSQSSTSSSPAASGSHNVQPAPPSVVKGTSNQNMDLENEKTYLNNMLSTGNAGEKAWARNRLDKINQQAYLQDMLRNGSSGQRSWAKIELEELTKEEELQNQKAYLSDTAQTGNAGQKKWAQSELDKINQLAYLQDMAKNGSSGQKKWAQNELDEINEKEKRLNQIEYLNGLNQTGNAGQQKWAQSELDKLKRENQMEYLQDMIENGTSGQRKWAQSQLDEMNGKQSHTTASTQQHATPTHSYSSRTPSSHASGTAGNGSYSGMEELRRLGIISDMSIPASSKGSTSSIKLTSHYDETSNGSHVFVTDEGKRLTVNETNLEKLLNEYKLSPGGYSLSKGDVFHQSHLHSGKVVDFLAYAASKGYDPRTFQQVGQQAQQSTQSYLEQKQYEAGIYEGYYASPGRKVLGELASITLDFAPVVGSVKGIVELVRGKNIFTGEELSNLEKALNAVSILAGSGFIDNVAVGTYKVGQKTIPITAEVKAELNKYYDKFFVKSGKAAEGAGYTGKAFSGTRNPELDFTRANGKSTLQKHFNDHKDDFGYTTETEYLNGAKNFLEKSPTSTTQSFVSDGGTYFRYDTATNEFGIINQYGGISTYYKPTDGLKYWQEQISLYAPK